MLAHDLPAQVLDANLQSPPAGRTTLHVEDGIRHRGTSCGRAMFIRARLSPSAVGRVNIKLASDTSTEGAKWASVSPGRLGAGCQSPSVPAGWATCPMLEIGGLKRPSCGLYFLGPDLPPRHFAENTHALSDRSPRAVSRQSLPHWSLYRPANGGTAQKNRVGSRLSPRSRRPWSSTSPGSPIITPATSFPRAK